MGRRLAGDGPGARREDQDTWAFRLQAGGWRRRKNGSLTHGRLRRWLWRRDSTHGLGPAEREWLVRANLFGSIALTILLWIVGGFVMGGFR